MALSDVDRCFLFDIMPAGSNSNHVQLFTVPEQRQFDDDLHWYISRSVQTYYGPRNLAILSRFGIVAGRMLPKTAPPKPLDISRPSACIMCLAIWTMRY